MEILRTKYKVRHDWLHKDPPRKLHQFVKSRVEEAISGDEEPSAAETSLKLAKGKMKTVSC